MALTRSLLSLLSIILLAGGIVMEFLIILSGTHIGTPENQIYFLQSSTNGITGGPNPVPNPARWTYFSVCGVTNGLNTDCSRVRAAQPFDPEGNFGTQTGLPDAFINTHRWYYLSRFAWVFFIIALFFAVLAFLLSVFALCARLGAYLAASMSFLALFFQTLCASLYTAWAVQGRNDFRASGQSANIGTKALAFSWATWACFFLCTLFFCIGGSAGKSDKSSQKKSYFGRKQSTRSRGSFIDNESGRRVKEEYE
nr:protein sur7 [Quercus suber]